MFHKNDLAKNVKMLPKQKCTCSSIMADYMDKLDSALLMVSKVLHLVRNEQAKSEDKPHEVLAVETFDDYLEEGVKTVDEPQVTIAVVDEASAKTLVDTEEITKAQAQRIPTPVNSFDDVQPNKKPVDKDSDEYKERIKAASNKFLEALGVLNKTCPNGIHLGYAIADCKCKVKVKQPGCPH